MIRWKTFVLSVGFCLAAPMSWGDELSVIASGKHREAINGYKVGSSYFLGAKEAGDLYGGQVYWYPVSGRVQMSFRGRQLQFVVGSQAAVVEGQSVTMDSAVMLRSNQAFIPLSFFLSEPFEAFVGMDSEFNARTKLLTVDRRDNLGIPRWFSYNDHTRLAFELGRDLGFTTSPRGVSGLEIVVPRGVFESVGDSKIADGIVESLVLLQEPKAARLQVRFGRPGLRYKVIELDNPRRVAIDVYSAEGAAVAAHSAPEESPLPPSVPAASAAPADIEEVPLKTAPPEDPAPRAARTKHRIVIDAGHGGKDSGALGRRGTMEKDFNLRAAKELAKLLKEDGVFDVVMTRDDDTFIPLADRSRIANEADADLFISLHCNGSPNSRENGYEVYFLSERASDPGAERTAEMENSSLELEGKSVDEEQAEALLHALHNGENINAGSEIAGLVARALRRRVDLEDRGVKQAAFYVLRGTYVPSILFEMAFVTNKKDEIKLESRQYRRKLIDGLYAGVLEYAQRQGWLKSGGRGS